jgi:hypothetical protein
VEAFAGPLFDEISVGDDGGARTSRLIVTIFGDPAEEMRNWTGPAGDTVRDRYLAAFGRALSGLSPEELWFRMRGDPRRGGCGPRRGLQPAPFDQPVPDSGRGGPALGDHVPGGSDEGATDRDLTTRRRLEVLGRPEDRVVVTRSPAQLLSSNPTDRLPASRVRRGCRESSEVACPLVRWWLMAAPE